MSKTIKVQVFEKRILWFGSSLTGKKSAAMKPIRLKYTLHVALMALLVTSPLRKGRISDLLPPHHPNAGCRGIVFAVWPFGNNACCLRSTGGGKENATLVAPQWRIFNFWVGGHSMLN
jgi:hypothetical protein